MAINYSNTTWVNGVTQRNATNFNHMETGIKVACDGVDTINSNLSITFNELSGGYTEYNDTVYKRNGIQYVNARIAHPIINAGSYMGIGYVPETPKSGLYFTGILVNDTNIIPALYTIDTDKLISIYLSNAIMALVGTGDKVSYINFSYPIQ